MQNFQNTFEFAQELDKNDALAPLREQFYIPNKNGKPVIYFCGNSLGLQPKNVREYIEVELQKWQTLGVEAHFAGEPRWYDYHKSLKPALCHLLGCFPHEVTIMNNLTANLHILFTTFYRPTPQRYKILIESPTFPSDYYAIESQIQNAGFDPKNALIEVFPDINSETISIKHLLQTIEQHREQLAIVFFGAVNYYTGQFFDLPAIVQKAHEVGAYAGFDLAHAIGNVPLYLHKIEADFATWCSYKYLNSGAGGVSGIYIHEKYATNTSLPRLAGWFGYDENERFLMKKGFKAIPTADGWLQSNFPILQMAVHRASLKIFEQITIEQLRQKSIQLTNFAEYVIEQAIQASERKDIYIITPKNPNERGCQLSIAIEHNGKTIYKQLKENNIIVDWREPKIIRLAPVPLYNTFQEVYYFGQVLTSILQNSLVSV
ncbi:MAG: kynureninase [Microscillaceae bacterium]|nr:kynureninase [Microscillaceae bacterium]MDW8461925.1 kynureninase [Cytophagales bacterium]